MTGQEDREEEALALIEDGVVANQNSFAVRYTLAATLARTGQYSLALEELDIVVHMEPENQAAQRLNAWVKEQLGKGRPGEESP